MEAEKYSIVVSPENLSSDLLTTIYTASTIYALGENECITPSTPYTENTQTVITYSGLSYILSGGTNGSSLLTGLTIPILFNQTYNDIGFYSEFDWGDGSPIDSLTSTTINHNYINTGNFTITLSGSNPWGVTVIQKPVTIPYQLANVPNPSGNIVFTPQQGSWANTPLSYNYIYDLDSDISVQYQQSSNWTTVPFIISGYTTSRSLDLKRYGPNPYTVGYVFSKNNQVFGQINTMTPDFTGYTINNIDYYDLSNGKTFYVVNSSGITANDIVASAITKNEYLLDFVMAPEVQSDVFIERGKYTAFEQLQRLGEVDNIGDMERYGYGFFKINKA